MPAWNIFTLFPIRNGFPLSKWIFQSLGHVSVYFSECICAGKWHANNVYFLDHIKNLSSFTKYEAWFSHLYTQWFLIDFTQNTFLVFWGVNTWPRKQGHLSPITPTCYSLCGVITTHFQLMPKSKSNAKINTPFWTLLFFLLEVFILPRQFSGLLTLYCGWRPCTSSPKSPHYPRHIWGNLQKATDPEVNV